MYTFDNAEGLETQAEIKKLNYLIIDLNGDILDEVKRALESLSVPKKNMAVAESLESAIQLIRELKPNFLIYHHWGDSEQIFKITDEYRKIIPDDFKRCFHLYSEKSDFSAFAQALEGDVDDYIIAPYSHLKIKSKMVMTIMKKNSPTEYRVMLNEIKKKIDAEEFMVAKKLCNVAATLVPRPCLAFYYSSIACEKEGDLTEAKEQVRKGLEFNKIHYRCLLRLHDIYVNENNHAHAYLVLKRIFQYFPIGPHRIMELIKLSIRTLNIDDLGLYCDRLVGKSEEKGILKFAVCGYVVSAMAIIEQDRDRALDYLVKASNNAKKEPSLLKIIYKGYADFEMRTQAEKILATFDTADRQGRDYKICLLMHEIWAERHSDIVKINIADRLYEIAYDFDCFRWLYQKAVSQGDKKFQSTLKNLAFDYYTLEEQNLLPIDK